MSIGNAGGWIRDRGLTLLLMAMFVLAIRITGSPSATAVTA
jgi:hypothetical protein